MFTIIDGDLRKVDPGMDAVNRAMRPVVVLSQYGGKRYEATDRRASDLLFTGGLMLEHPEGRDEAVAFLRHAASTMRMLERELEETLNDARTVAR